jgi:hypothetical protein
VQVLTVVERAYNTEDDPQFVQQELMHVQYVPLTPPEAPTVRN